MNAQLESKRVALIIGAGDATGGAIAKRFAREGYVACVTRRSADKLQPLWGQSVIVDNRAGAGGAIGAAAVARAEAFAGRLLSETDGSTAELVRRAWRVAIGRSPSSTEAAVAAEFIDSQRKQYQGDAAARWAVADFCQMLLASNAFLYVE